MLIRPALASDVPAACRLWRERMALLQQTDPQIQFAPEAEALWSQAAINWIQSDEVGFLVGERQGALVGFSVVGIAPGKPGLQPRRCGLLLEMAVDLHDTHRGLSQELLAHAKRWLAASGITLLAIDAPARYPLEAAFWRAQGATAHTEGLRLRI